MAYGLADFNRYFNEVATFPIVPPGIEDPLNHLIDTGLACIGTPDDCIRHFERRGMHLEARVDKLIHGLYNVMQREWVLIFRKD